MGQKKILIADDEEDILDILEKKLKQMDYDVMTVANGDEIIPICKFYKPDLIILDIIMPRIDGYTVAQNIREEKTISDTPIIFMTAKELEYSGIKKRLLDINNTDFIAKPCSFEELLVKIKEKI